jgi:hypothetical protein
MTTIRLYFDEDTMRHSLVRALRSRGIDVITALDAGMIERPDADHVAYASSQGRVLCSSNAGDYYRLHTDHLASGKTHVGIIVIAQQRYTVGDQMRRILKLIAVRTAVDMRDRIEFLSAWG